MTIKKATYSRDDDAVRWETTLPDDSTFTFSWPLGKYGHAIGVTKENVRIPEVMLVEHLEQLTRLQKVFTWQMNQIGLNDTDNDQVNKAMKQLLAGHPTTYNDWMKPLSEV